MTLLPRPNPRVLVAIAAGVGVLATSACGSSDQEPSASSSETTIVTGFYPLEFIATRVAGDLATVDTLTAPGAEPHDVELSPQAVGSVGTADLVLYSADLQAAVDDAVEQQGGDHTLDVNEAADLISTGAEHEHEGEHEGEHEHEGADTSLDPHFWLDPARMGSVTDLVAERLVEMDPDHATTYQSNADALVAELEDLDAAYRDGLASCEQEQMVTTHEAFGYLALNYGFDQVGIAGISPEAEPSPARLAEVATLVRETGVDTIYSEVLVGADIAETVATETGAEVLVLDPVEGLTEESAGQDYLEVMRSNLDTLRTGQQCS
ncbi:MAG: metal ABC transporter substrate-binding protein [Ornithinimicrobium sp.]